MYEFLVRGQHWCPFCGKRYGTNNRAIWRNEIKVGCTWCQSDMADEDEIELKEVK